MKTTTGLIPLAVLAGFWVALAGAAPAGHPIPVGAIFALTGEAAESDIQSLQGIQIALSEINAAGGIDGRPFALTVFDNRSTPIGAKIAADEAVNDGVVAVLGPAWSSHCLSAAPVLQRHRIPMITNIATHPDITRIGDCIFRVCFTDDYQGRILARFAREELGADRAVILVDLVSHYSMTLGRIFGETFSAHGGTLTGTFSYKGADRDFEPMLQAARQTGPNLIFIPGHQESGRIIRQAAGMGIALPVLGGDGWNGEPFNRNGGIRLARGYFTTHWAPEVDYPASRDFLRRCPLSVHTLDAGLMLAYDATTLLADAIRRAGTPEPEAIRSALAKTRNFPGVTGPITMNRWGDPVKQAVLMGIEAGRTTYLKTLPPPVENPP